MLVNVNACWQAADSRGAGAGAPGCHQVLPLHADVRHADRLLPLPLTHLPLQRAQCQASSRPPSHPALRQGGRPAVDWQLGFRNQLLQWSFVWSTEYTRSGNSQFVATFHHDGKNSPAWWRCGWCMPTPFHYIYHHVQSCSVRPSWEGRYTQPISSLPLYVLCGMITDQWANYVHNEPMWMSDNELLIT